MKEEQLMLLDKYSLIIDNLYGEIDYFSHTSDEENQDEISIKNDVLEKPTPKIQIEKPTEKEEEEKTKKESNRTQR